MRLLITLALLTSTCGCGGGGGGGAPAPVFVATPLPTPSPTPPPGGALNASPTAAAFTLPGQTATIVASETGYAGLVAPEASACSGIASVTPASPTAAPATFTVTAQGAGACMLAFTDRFGQRATVAVGVTVTQGTIK